MVFLLDIFWFCFVHCAFIVWNCRGELIITRRVKFIDLSWKIHSLYTGLSLRARGRGFSPATKRVARRLLLLENGEKIEPKEIPSRLIPRLLVVFTCQLEILVTTLLKYPKMGICYFSCVASRGSDDHVK